MARTSKTPAAVRQARAHLLRRLAAAISTDATLLELLAQSAAPQTRGLFVDALAALASAWGQTTLLTTTNSDLFSDILNWTTTNRAPEQLRHAVTQYHTDRRLKRKLHRYVIDQLGLNRHSGAGRRWLANTKTYTLRRLEVAYPPLREHVVESDEIDGLWRHHLENEPLAEPRAARRPLHRLDPTCLALTIPAEEDCILVDEEDGSIIAVVLRGATEEDGNAEFLEWATAAVKDGICGRRSIRRDDPGLMIQTGYTPGLRSKPLFAWVRNLSGGSETLSPEFLASSDYASSCLLAVAWNIFRSRFPAIITEDWVEFLREHEMPPMDAGVGMSDLRGAYAVQYGEDSIVFHDAELAPGSGLLNWNYSRAIHFEKQPHTYAFQWITERTHDDTYGGHFYIASYGVRIMNTADTMIAWRPADLHGTSLAAFSPKDPSPPYAQSGVCCSTSNRLAGVHAKFKEALQSHRALGQERIKFAKRWTAADAAAEAAAQEFAAQIAAGVLERLDGGTGNS